MRKLVTIGLMVALTGCVSPRQDTKSTSYVDIYSTTSVAIAQDRADKLCGSHAYLLDRAYDAKSARTSNIQRSIPFNCDLDQAAYSGSSEARDISLKKTEEAYKDYYKAIYQQKEMRRKNADPAKYESYTETDPDGTVRTYGFSNGKSCETIVHTDGTARASCE